MCYPTDRPRHGNLCAMPRGERSQRTIVFFPVNLGARLHCAFRRPNGLIHRRGEGGFAHRHLDGACHSTPPERDLVAEMSCPASAPECEAGQTGGRREVPSWGCAAAAMMFQVRPLGGANGRSSQLSPANSRCDSVATALQTRAPLGDSQSHCAFSKCCCERLCQGWAAQPGPLESRGGPGGGAWRDAGNAMRRRRGLPRSVPRPQLRVAIVRNCTGPLPNYCSKFSGAFEHSTAAAACSSWLLRPSRRWLSML
jgi:hypothetical protein